MNYLITGGLGLIGSSLANSLEGNITIVTRSKRNQARLRNNQAKILVKTLQELTSGDLQGTDIIYHCASTVDNYNILDDPYIDVETNIKGTIHLLELCRSMERKPKVIFLSTFFVYGNEYDKTKVPITEESRTDPLAVYPATKLCAESVIKTYSGLFGIPFLIVRLTNVYSELEQYDNKKKGAFNYLVMQAVKGETIQLYNGGNFYRDYIHVNDVTAALRHLENRQNSLFLIGYGKPILFKKMVNRMLELTGNKSNIIEIDPPEFHKVVGISNFIADTSKALSTGWKALISPEEGIERIVKEYQALLQS